MYRIIWLVACSALLLYSKVFTLYLDQIPWLALVGLIAVAELIIMLTMIPQPIKEFIQPPMNPLQQELTAKIRMIKEARASGRYFVQVFVSGSGWLEGRVLQLSESYGVLLLEVSEELGQEIVHLKDVVRIRTSATRLGTLLESNEIERAGKRQEQTDSEDTVILHTYITDTPKS